MLIQAGYELVYNCVQQTPMILMVNIHYSRASDMVSPDLLTTTPTTRVTSYRDRFGNWCSRLVAPIGKIQLAGKGVIRRFGANGDPGHLSPPGSLTGFTGRHSGVSAGQPLLRDGFVSDFAWARFGQTLPGGARVQAICDFVHNHITFNYQNARPRGQPGEAFNEQTGVCRDFTPLAITLCRAMNIPARTVPDIWATWDSLRHTAPGISRPGWKCIWKAAGIHSIRATIRPGLDERLSPEGAMRPMSPSPQRSVPALWKAFRSSPMRLRRVRPRFDSLENGF